MRTHCEMLLGAAACCDDDCGIVDEHKDDSFSHFSLVLSSLVRATLVQQPERTGSHLTNALLRRNQRGRGAIAQVSTKIQRNPLIDPRVCLTALTQHIAISRIGGGKGRVQACSPAIEYKNSEKKKRCVLTLSGGNRRGVRGRSGRECLR